MLRRTLLERLAAILAGIGSSGIAEIAAAIEAAGTPLGIGSEGETETPSERAEPRYRTAVVDRIVDGRAAVQFEAEGEETVVATEVLPESAREEGVVLRVPPGRSLAIATVDRAATARRRRRAGDRFDDVAETPPGDGNGSTT